VCMPTGNAKDGTPCGTSTGICYMGSCSNGCEIGGEYFTANAANPLNSCQTCQPGFSTSMWEPNPGPACGSAGQNKCGYDGVCEPTCTVGGTVYYEGEGTGCQMCWPAASSTTLSPCSAAGWLCNASAHPNYCVPHS
jgi:hypothetical protein